MTHDASTIASVFGNFSLTHKRQRIEFRSINHRNVIVIRKGPQMGKRGPKRKEGYLREANGRADRRTTAQRINEANLRDIRQQQAVVLNQPHRRGSDDRFCSSALGRFCLRAGCSKETYDGVEAYGVTHKRWLLAIGKPLGFDKVTSIGSGEGPTPEQIARWKLRVDEVNKMLMAKFPAPIVGLVLRLVIDDVDLTEDQFASHHGRVRTALGEVSVCTGFLSRNPHPF